MMEEPATSPTTQFILENRQLITDMRESSQSGVDGMRPHCSLSVYILQEPRTLM